MIEARPETLIGDRAYDSDRLNNELKKQGVEIIAPHRSNRRILKTQEGGPAAAPLRAALDRGTVLHVAALEASLTDPLGALRPQLPWIRATGVHRNAPLAILR